MNKLRAQEIVANFDKRRILVVGDVMLDEYIWGQVNRISPEAPVIVVNADRETQVPGGAANVVNNLCALGATGIIVGVVGSDEAGQALKDSLRAEGAETHGLIALDDRPTTRKTRIIAHSQQVVRVNHEKRTPIGDSTAMRIAELITELAAGADAILLSDYQKGVLSPIALSASVRAAQKARIPVTGNLKPAALTDHSSLSVLTLNLHEASTAVGGKSLSTEDDIRNAGKLLLARTGSANVLITRGANGLSLLTADGEHHHIPARPVEVYDVAGAGDTVISTLTLALAAGANMLEAVKLANIAASEAVKKLGVSTVSPAEILNSF